MADGIRWLPLESNPDVMTKFLASLGVASEYSLVDIIGFDDELLAFVPQPVLAVILLFPVSQADSTEPGDESLREKCYFVKQTIQNACGTIALLHSVANNVDKLKFSENSAIKKYLDDAASLSSEEKGKLLETNTDICTNHETSAQEGQTEAPELSQDIDFHFVAFVERGGRLYQLDGRKKGPIDHGVSSPATILADAAKVCKEFMARNEQCIQFTSVALVKQ